MSVAAAKSLHLCPTLRDPIDSSPPGSPVPGILQARILEWVALSFSNAWKWKVKVKSLSHVQLLVTPWAATYQAPPPMGFSRQEYWSGLQEPSPHVHTTVFKMDNQWGPIVWHIELCSMLCARMDGRGVWGGMDTCICTAESLHCSPKPTTTLLIDYTLIQNKKFKK